MGWSSHCFLLSLVEIGPVVPEKILEGFLPKMGVAATRSRDPDAANKRSFPLLKEAPHTIWF